MNSSSAPNLDPHQKNGRQSGCWQSVNDCTVHRRYRYLARPPSCLSTHSADRESISPTCTILLPTEPSTCQFAQHEQCHLLGYNNSIGRINGTLLNPFASFGDTTDLRLMSLLPLLTHSRLLRSRFKFKSMSCRQKPKDRSIVSTSGDRCAHAA
jgi:hypothetical protein